MAKGKPTRKGKGEGSIFQLPDGSWRGFITAGYDAKGRQVKRWRRGRTRRDVATKLNKIATLSGSRLVTAPERVTVEEWLRRHVELRSPEIRPSTRQAYKQYLNKILPELGHIQLQRLTPLHVRTFQNKLVTAGLSPSVRQHVHHFLKRAVREALKLELVERNVVEMVDTPKGGTVTEATAWTPIEAITFLQAAQNDRLYGAFYLLITQGLRIGEVLGLRWTDLDGDTLHVQRTVSYIGNKAVYGPTKTKRGDRVLYLTPDALTVVAERREQQAIERDIADRWEDTGLIFSSTVGTVMNPHNFRRSYRKLIKLAGVRRVRVHDLRHTYITLARDAGVDAEVVAQRAGQDVRVTLKIYSKVTEDRKRKAALSLDQLMGGTLAAPRAVNEGSTQATSSQLVPCDYLVLHVRSVLKRPELVMDGETSHARGRRFNPYTAHHNKKRHKRKKARKAKRCVPFSLSSGTLLAPTAVQLEGLL